MIPLRARIHGVLRHQASVWTRLVTGRRVSPVPLGSGTLDAEDVHIARDWLQRGAAMQDDPDTVTRFEDAFAAWNGSPSAVAFASGRESLSAIIRALGLQPGDEVILPGYTCVVVPNAFEFAGIAPVYADIELDT
jgi:dTDP-4-amino-4,6-dideoxygalactose transaminase